MFKLAPTFPIYRENTIRQMMPYRIPSDEKLAEAVFVVMYRNQQVVSQKEMASLVLKELEKDGEEYRVSGERIRRLAVNNDLAQLSIDYNESDGELPETCPVCRNNLTSVKNSTLDGGTIEISRKCTKCPFSVGSVNRTPGRYTFIRKKR